MKNGLLGPTVEVQLIEGVRWVIYRSPGAPLKKCTVVGAILDAEAAELRGDVELGRLLRSAANKLAPAIPVDKLNAANDE